MIHNALNLGRRHWLLTGVAFVAAAVSISALLLHAAGWLPMYFLIDILGAPSLVLLLILGIIAARIDARVFLDRLIVGAWGGIAATLAYDAIRLLIRAGNLISFNPFQTHPAFGRLITGQPEETMLAILVGWAYHFWNGFGFGIMYTLIAGNARWVYALVWAMFLEIGWLTALPSTFQLRLNPEVVAVSFIGHGAYGVVLGLIAQRFIRA
ncbi:MAG: hypothetical protein HZC40_13440 [Chloroflexi bacterium]|nr:hypothetical protein [Chloroflexota bacterium]